MKKKYNKENDEHDGWYDWQSGGKIMHDDMSDSRTNAHNAPEIHHKGERFTGNHRSPYHGKKDWHGNTYHDDEIKAANGFHGIVDIPTHILASEDGEERVDITPRKSGMSDYFDIDLMEGFGETSYDIMSQKKTKKQTGDFDFMSGFNSYL